MQPAANPVYLNGAAYDADDGVLTGTALQWTDSVQGALGSGQFVAASLQPGAHTITPAGSTAYSSLTLNVSGGASSSAGKTASALAGGGVVVALCLLVPGVRRRRRMFAALLLVALAFVLTGMTSCTKFGAFSSTVTVTATSGALQHTSTINLSVK